MSKKIPATLVCFASAFAYESAPNITHAVMDGSAKTLCGRKRWMTTEGRLDDECDGEHWEPDCLKCSKAVRKIRGEVPS